MMSTHSLFTSLISQLNLISLVNCSPNLTSGDRADRQSSLNGKRCLWLSSPSQRQGSVYCRLHSSLSPQRACRGRGGDKQTCSLDARIHFSPELKKTNIDMKVARLGHEPAHASFANIHSNHCFIVV